MTDPMTPSEQDDPFVRNIGYVEPPTGGLSKQEKDDFMAELSKALKKAVDEVERLREALKFIDQQLRFVKIHTFVTDKIRNRIDKALGGE